MSLLDSALEYAAAGYRVFPTWSVRSDGSCLCGDAACTSPGKHPVGRLAPQGVKDATDDEAVVRAWWSAEPEANISIATGGGFFVIDCDRSSTFDGVALFLELARQKGELPDTADSITGGGGAHFCFAVDEGVEVRNQQGLLVDGQRIKGIDVRGDGGYIVAPPSRHASGGRYTWAHSIFDDLSAAPAWLVEIAAKGSVAPAPLAPELTRTASGFLTGREMVPDVLAEVIRALEFIPPDCDRTTWVERVGMPIHDATGGSEFGFDLWAEWSARAAGKVTPTGNAAYDTTGHELVVVWRSFHADHRNPKGLASLFETAIAGGYVPPCTATPVVGEGVAPGAVLGLENPLAPAFDADELAAILANQPGDPGSYPIDLIEDVRGALAAVVSWVMDCAHRPDPILAFAAALGFFSAALGRRVQSEGGGRAVLTLAALARSGGGKEIPQACVKNLLDGHPGLVVALLDDAPLHRAQLDHALLRHRGQALMQLDEYGSTLARWLKGADLSSAMSPTIRRLATHSLTVYKLAPLSLKHPARAEDVGKWDAGIYGPAFTLVGFSTPGQFYDSLTDASLVDGFLGRHVVLSSSEVPELVRIPGSSTDDFPPEVMAWCQEVAQIPIPRTGPPSAFMRPPEEGVPAGPPDMAPADPRTIMISPDAAELDERLSSELDAVSRSVDRNDDGEAFGALLRRIPGQAASLALVLACAESATPGTAIIEVRHVAMAYRIARWSADLLGRRLWAGTAIDDTSRAHRRIVETIERREGERCYRSFFGSKSWAVSVLPRVWPSILADPRFESGGVGKDGKPGAWVRLRDTDRNGST